MTKNTNDVFFIIAAINERVSLFGRYAEIATRESELIPSYDVGYGNLVDQEF